MSSTVVQRNKSLDYLRAFLMFLVIMHHSFLAYTPSGYGALINDPDNVKAFEVITGYLDTFFMSLFFLISGLFALRSVEKKGVAAFIADRIIRLLVPFVLGILLINVLGFYFSFVAGYKLAPTWQNLGDFLRGSFAVTPAGPLWFLWVLFMFDLIIALLHKGIKRWNDRIRSAKSRFFTESGRFLLAFIGLGFLAYSLFDVFSPYGFIVVLPPFEMQIGRAGLYFFFFLVGAMLGVFGVDRSVLGRDSNVSKRWWLLIPLSVLATVALKIVVDVLIKGESTPWLTTVLTYLARLGLVLSCTLASLGFFGLFNRIVRGSSRFCDLMADKAMGIYVVHYTVVTVLQYLLLKANIAGLYKGILVTVGAFLISLALVVLIKKIPVLRLSVGGRVSGKYKPATIALTVAGLAGIVIMHMMQ